MSKRDPEAASLLIAHVVAAREEQGDERRADITGYDPLSLYDYMCKEYQWRPRDIDAMHYPLFFALVEKANERHRRENEAQMSH